MAINVENIIPQKGFNSLFSLIENCDIIEPPYAKQYETAQLFLKRRDGITEVITESNYIFYDIKEFKDNAGNKYIVVAEDKTTNEVVVFELNGTTLTELNRKPKGNIIDIVNVTGGVEQLDTGTAAEGGVDADTGEGYLMDINKTNENYIVKDIASAPISVGFPNMQNIVSDGTNIYQVGGSSPSISNGVFSINPEIPKISLKSYKSLSKPTAKGALIEYNGKLYLIGGENYSDKINILNKSTLEWETPITMPYNIVGATAQLYNGKIYIYGGGPDRMIIYDIDNNTFSEGANLPRTGDGFCSVLIGSKMYVMGGGSVETYEYDINNDTFTRLADMPGIKQYASAFVYNNYIYVVYGGDNKTYNYLPGWPNWNIKADSNYSGYSPGLAFYHPRFVRVLGVVNDFKVEEYDVYNDTWTVCSGVYDEAYIHIKNSATYYDGRNLWVIGGYNDEWGHYTNNTIQKYNPDTNTWEPYYSLPFGVDEHAVAMYDDTFYIFSGEWSGTSSNQNKIFKFYKSGNYGGIRFTNSSTNIYESPIITQKDNYVYLTGGMTSSGHNYNLYKYDLVSDTITQLSSCPVHLDEGSRLKYFNNKLIAIRGYGVYIYDIATDTWTTANPFPDNFYGGAIIEYNNKIYVVSNHKLYKYIESDDKWEYVVDVPSIYGYLTSINCNNKSYIFNSELDNNKEINPTGGVWNTNEFAGAYVYISSGTGVGSLRYITRNDGYTLYVSGWDAYPTEGSGYVIYDRLGNNFLIPYNGGVLKYDGTTAEPEYVFDGTNVKGMVVWDGRLWYENKNKIFYSGAGDYYYFSAMDNLVMLDDINNMKPLGSNMLITSTTNMYLITKFVQGGNTFYSLKEVYSENGIKNRGGIVFHQGGVYVLGSDNNLYAFNLQNYGNGEVKVVLNDLGITPSNFLKEHSQSDIQLYSDGNNLYIYTTEGEAYELVYLKRYEGYINNKYGVNIKKKVLLENTLYYLGDGYIGIKGGDKDIDKNINMKISANMFVNNVFQWADVKVLNILLGNKGKPQKGILKFTHQIANRKNTYVFDLSNTGYLSDIDDITNNNIVGGNIVGMGNNGGDVISNISDIDIIKIPLDKSGQLFNIDVENTNGEELIFGGVQIYYNSISPLLHTYKNIL